MDSTTLEALRRLLFFSRPEAARYIAASDERPNGVSERAWRMFESGDLPVPTDVCERVDELITWRFRTIERLSKLQVTNIPKCPRSEAEFKELKAGGPMYFRPFQSALAEIYAQEQRI